MYYNIGREIRASPSKVMGDPTKTGGETAVGTKSHGSISRNDRPFVI